MSTEEENLAADLREYESVLKLADPLRRRLADNPVQQFFGVCTVDWTKPRAGVVKIPVLRVDVLESLRPVKTEKGRRLMEYRWIATRGELSCVAFAFYMDSEGKLYKTSKDDQQFSDYQTITADILVREILQALYKDTPVLKPLDEQKDRPRTSGIW